LKDTVPWHKPSLAAAYHRVERARHHLAELTDTCEQAADYWGEILVGRFDKPLPANELAAQLTGRMPIPVIPPLIPILVGETAYNLRAALDYSVGQLSRLRAPMKRGDRLRRSQFPVERSRKHFMARRSTFMQGLTDADAGFLETYQPYKGSIWAARIAKLSNIDKHNTLIRVEQGMGFHFDEESEAGRHVLVLEPYLVIAFHARTRVVPTVEILAAQVVAFLDALKPQFD
jgi:hypothetical protein